MFLFPSAYCFSKECKKSVCRFHWKRGGRKLGVGEATSFTTFKEASQLLESSFYNAVKHNDVVIFITRVYKCFFFLNRSFRLINLKLPNRLHPESCICRKGQKLLNVLSCSCPNESCTKSKCSTFPCQMDSSEHPQHTLHLWLHAQQSGNDGLSGIVWCWGLCFGLSLPNTKLYLSVIPTLVCVSFFSAPFLPSTSQILFHMWWRSMYWWCLDKSYIPHIVF